MSTIFSLGQSFEVGLFGKLPSHGDFLRRRASDAFVDTWDAWVRDCLAASRTALGARWLDFYLTSPAWRFLCAAGTCGPEPVIGLMVPSVDRVGRYFPFTLVANLPHDINPIAAATASSTFFERAEELVIETLATEDIDFERFDQRVVALGETLASIAAPTRVVLDPAAAAILGSDAASWQIPIGSTAELGPVFEQLLAHRLSSIYEPLVLWWTEGSSVVEPSCLVAKGLPHPSTFASLLDGTWAQSRWRSVQTRIETGPPAETLVEHGTPVAYRSASASDAGLSREVNEDAFVERPEVGVWAVADGLGHKTGEVASHMVCDALAELVPDPSFEGTIDAVRRRLNAVNDYLLHMGAPATPTGRSASTAVLLARGMSWAILCAGDSRVYRWRSGRLERLTHDQRPAGRDGHPGGESSLAAGAAGVPPTLALDVLRDAVSPGDRFLLCSDGLTPVPEPQIEEWMGSQDIAAAAAGLVGAALEAGAPDDVTVLIAEAYVDAVISA